MTKELYVNLNADSPTKSLVRSVTNSQRAFMPDLVLNDTGSYALFLVNGDGAYAAETGETTDYSLKAGIGVPGAVPSAGYWQASQNQETSNIDYNVTAANLQQSLRAFSTVSVQGNNPVFVVEFTGTGANKAQALIKTWGTRLFPPSNITVTDIQTGDTTKNAKQMIRIHADPLAQQPYWYQIDKINTDNGAHLAYGFAGTIGYDAFGVHVAVPTTSPVTVSFEVEVTNKVTGHRHIVAQQDVRVRPRGLYP